MVRTDFIENRIDVVKNIYTLYSYVKSTVEEDKVTTNYPKRV